MHLGEADRRLLDHEAEGRQDYLKPPSRERMDLDDGYDWDR